MEQGIRVYFLQGGGKRMTGKKMNKVLTYIALIAIIVVNVVGNGGSVKAEGKSYKTKATVDGVEITAGGKQHVEIPFRLLNPMGDTITYQDFSVEPVNAENCPISVISDVTLIEKYAQTAPTYLLDNTEYILSFDIEADEMAKNGTYKMIMVGNCYTHSFDSGDIDVSEITFSKKLSVKVVGQKAASKLKISNIDYNSEVECNEEFDITFKLTNHGDIVAKDVSAELGDFTSSSEIVPDYATSSMTLGDIKGGSTQSVRFPVKVSSKATAGLKPFKITVTWWDDKKNEGYTVTSNLYINVVVPEDSVIKNSKPNIVISDVKQTPDAPIAKGTVTVSYTVENKGASVVKQLKFTPSNMAASGLSPVSSKPYIYIDELKPGKKKVVKMKFKLSDDISEGLHELTFAFTYKYVNKDGNDYEDGTENVSLFIRDVENPTETVNTSVPKLIIYDFSTGDKPLKAGAKFLFKFDVKNTHPTMAAKNIKVTISSENNIFSQTAGSNSFYVEQIPAGATVTESMELKVKGDAASNAYPLKVSFEYEYEGKTTATDGKTQVEGTAEKTIDEILNIQVAENARPVVQDIYLSSYEQPKVNEVTTLTFNFYNMGKSELCNVAATVVSDNYQASDTSTRFIGNVKAGEGSTYEIDVIPIMEGECPGKLKITYEDSNGETVELFADFTATISPAESMGGMEGMPGMDMGEMNMPETPKAKKALVPTWLFIVIQVVIFVVAVVAARKIVIAIYKKKLRKQEEEDI